MMTATSLPYPEKYEQAVRYTESRSEVKAFPQDLQLLLYALKQQVAQGPAASAKAPSTWSFSLIENAKYQAWKQLGDMSSMEAMRLFVRTLEEEIPEWYSQLTDADAAQEGTNHPDAAPGAPTAAAPAQDAAPAPAANEPVSHQGNSQSPEASMDGTAPVGPAAPVAAVARDDVWSCVTTQVAAAKRLCPRYEHSAALLGSQLYVVGGNYAGRYLGDVWRLNVDTSTWEQVSAPAPQPPAAATGTEQESGKEAGSDQQQQGAAAAGSQQGFQPCAGHAMVVWQGKLLILGGHAKARTANAAGPLPVRLLDPATGAVTVLEASGSSPSARGGLSATLMGDQLWVFGGEDATRKPTDELHCLDLGSMNWSQPLAKSAAAARKKLWPAPRSAHSAVAYLNRYVVIFGGGSSATCYPDVWVLDTRAESGPAWVPVAPQGQKVSPRAGHSAVIHGDIMYVVGGGNNVRGCTDLLALDLSGLKQHAAASAAASTEQPAEASAASAPVVWYSLQSTPPRDPLSSEGVSLVLLEKGPQAMLLAFGGYNGKYHNTVSVINAPSLPQKEAVGAEGGDSTGSAAPANGHQNAEVGLAGPKQPLTINTAAANGRKGQEGVVTPKVPKEAQQPLPEVDILKAEIIRLKAALSAAQEEAEAAVKECAAVTARDAHEVALLRKQLATSQAALETATKGLDDARAAMARESARALRLEAEIAELRHQLGAAAEQAKELEALRRQVKEGEMSKSRSGIWGYISGQ